MLTPSTNYQTEHDRLFRTPVYMTEFEGVGEVNGYFASVMLDKPVAYYRLSDALATSIAGALVGDADPGVDFNGTSNYITVPDNAVLDFTTQFTIEGYLYKDSLAAERYVCDKDDVGGATADTWGLSVTTTGALKLYRKSTDSATSDASVITAARWVHFAVTFDNNASPKTIFYVNGAQAGTSTGIAGVFTTNARTLLIGRNGAGNYWNGSLDEIAFYNYAVSPDRILTHYTAGWTPFSGKFSTHKVNDTQIEVLRDAPSIYLRFGESSGTAADDTTANGLDGIYAGSYALAAAGALIGDPDTAVTLTAAGNGRVTVADDTLLDPGDTFSLEIWVKRTRTGTAETFIDKGTGGYQLGVNSSDEIIFTKTGTGVIVTSLDLLDTTGIWYHVAVTKAIATVALYINGLDTTGTVSNQTIVATASDLNIGRTVAGAGYFDGSLDEFSLYSFALPRARVRGHYLASQAQWTLPYMRTPSGSSSRVIPEEGRSSIGTITDTIVDKDYRLTRVISDGILGRVATHKAGFAGLPEHDFAELPAMVVDDFGMLDDATGFSVVSRDVAVLGNRSVFDVATSFLTGPMTSGASSMDINDTTYFGASGYARIDDEIVSYTTNLTGTLSGLVRGEKGTTAAAHSTDAQVIEVIVLGPAHPFDIAQDVITGTSKSGMGISSTLVDTVRWDSAKVTTGSDLQMEFRITERENGKQWLEREIFIPMAAYPITTADGIGIKAFRQPIPTDVAGSIDNDAIIGTPKWRANGSSIINKVIFLHDWNAITQKFDESQTVEDVSSQAIYGTWPLVIESRGFRTDLTNTDDYMAQRGRAILRRYANTAPIVQVDTHLQKNLMEPSDIIEITSDKVPNRANGTRGVTDELMEIVNRDVEWIDGRVRFELLATGWSAFIAVIAPAGTVSYTSGTAADHKTYIYVSDAVGLNPDGSVAAVIGTA